MFDSLWPHESQHTRPPCPPPTPGVYPNPWHQVSDAIQPSHPLSSPSPPAPNPSQHQSLFQWVLAIEPDKIKSNNLLWFPTYSMMISTKNPPFLIFSVSPMTQPYYISWFFEPKSHSCSHAFRKAQFGINSSHVYSLETLPYSLSFPWSFKCKSSVSCNYYSKPLSKHSCIPPVNCSQASYLLYVVS